MRIQGSVVLITGASEGIGAACVEPFRRRGAHLILVARRREKLDAFAGSGALIVPADVTIPADRERVFAAARERFQGVDILINNAGVGLYAPAWRTPIADVQRMFDLNVFAALAMAQHATPHMIAQRRGMIVNVSSIAGKVTLPWFTMYSASKYALGAMTDGLRMELKPHGVLAMTVCPGYVRTAFQDHVLAGTPPPSIRRARRFAITAESCAEAIARGVERNARTVVVPRAGWFLIAMQRALPRLMEAWLARMLQSLERE